MTDGETGSLLLFTGLDGERRAIRARHVGHIEDLDASNIVRAGDTHLAQLGSALVPAMIDGPLPDSGALAALRLCDTDGRQLVFPVRAVDDVIPIGSIAAIDDGVTEGVTLFADAPVKIMQWPRAAAPAPRKVRGAAR